MPGFAPSIYFTVLAKFQTMTYIKKEKKRTNRLKKKTKQTVTERQILKTMNITHYAMYNPNK